MPSRQVVAKELTDIFKILAHPDRIRLIEELRVGELDVNTLHERLDLRAARVSQHLSLMRAFRIVEERREGRHVYYHLTQPELADWIIEGLRFLECRFTENGANKSALEDAKWLWTHPEAAKS